MGTTPRGIVYAEPGDDVNLWQKFQDQAESVDPLIGRLLKGAPIQAPSTGVFNTDGVITQITIPDPGVPYRLLVGFDCWAFSSAGSVWDVQVHLDSLAGAIIHPAKRLPATDPTYGNVVLSGAPSDVLTGSHVLYFAAIKISGVGGLNARFSLDPVVQAFWAMQLPA